MSLKDELDSLEQNAQQDAQTKHHNSLIPSLNAYQVKYYPALGSYNPTEPEREHTLKTEIVFAHNSLFEDNKLIFQRMFPNNKVGPVLKVVRALSSWEELELLPETDSTTTLQ